MSSLVRATCAKPYGFNACSNATATPLRRTASTNDASCISATSQPLPQNPSAPWVPEVTSRSDGESASPSNAMSIASTSPSGPRAEGCTWVSIGAASWAAAARNFFRASA